MTSSHMRLHMNSSSKNTMGLWQHQLSSKAKAPE
jgi:hypothetical protein